MAASPFNIRLLCAVDFEADDAAESFFTLFYQMNFRSVKNYEGLYLVSNSGVVKSVRGRYRLGKKLKAALGRDGYLKVCLYKNGKKQTPIHRIVALSFLGEGEEVNHKNGIKTDNRVENLEWVSGKENNLHALREGLRNPLKKAKPVLQFQKTGFFLKKWDSIIEASRALNIQHGHISSCCRGKIKSIGGFIFKYL